MKPKKNVSIGEIRDEYCIIFCEDSENIHLCVGEQRPEYFMARIAKEYWNLNNGYSVDIILYRTYFDAFTGKELAGEGAFRSSTGRKILEKIQPYNILIDLFGYKDQYDISELEQALLPFNDRLALERELHKQRVLAYDRRMQAKKEKRQSLIKKMIPFKK